MKLPNGYGSVYKLSGKRRRPWVARKTTGWTFDEKMGKSYPIYKFVGYYATKKEALEALALYNDDPYNFQIDNITLEDLYTKWSEEHYKKVSANTEYAYTFAFRCFEPIKHMKVKDIKLIDIQQAIDESHKHKSTVELAKVVISMMYGYGVKYEFISAAKRDVIRYLDTTRAGNPNKIERTAFNQLEMETLWSRSGSDRMAKIILIMIYSGLRRGELLDLRVDEVNINQKYFDITKSKTPSGVREVPISDKIMPFVKEFIDEGNEYLISFKQHHYIYTTFRNNFMEYMNEIGASHRPHDTRHTFVTMMTEQGIDRRIIQAIVGHKQEGITGIYTHISLDMMLKEINKI